MGASSPACAHSYSTKHRQGGLKARHPSWEPVPWPIETHLICGHKARVPCASEESPVGSVLASMFGTCEQACFGRVILNTVLVNRQHALQQVTVERQMLPSTRNPKSTPQIPPKVSAHTNFKKVCPHPCPPVRFCSGVPDTHHLREA